MAGGEVQENTITSLREECQNLAEEILVSLRDISAMSAEEVKDTSTNAPSDYPNIPSNIAGLIDLRGTLRVILSVLVEGVVRRIK